MATSETIRDKILLTLERKNVAIAYKAGNNAWRKVADALGAKDKRSLQIEALARQSLDSVVNQETNVGWVGSDAFERFPAAPMGRHKFLQGLHQAVRPRAYLEIGIDNGASLSFVDVPAIGVDPAPNITYKLAAATRVYVDKSDDFFARPNAVEHFGGVPVDLAFIDGMHLSEFALRDFMNLEKLMGPTGVVVFDDMLPRNALEAFRIRRTNAWAGDVYKVQEILIEHRPDLVVLPLNTNPTGTLLVTNLDPTSTVLDDNYDGLEKFCSSPDPQHVSTKWTRRETAADPRALIASGAWQITRSVRDGNSPTETLAAAWDILRATPPVN